MNLSSLRHSRLQRGITAHLQFPLYRAAYSLLCSDAITGALGLVYWALAARYYTSEQLGHNSAMLSSIMLIAGLTTICLKGALLRFLPVAGASARTLIVGGYAVSTTMAALATVSAALIAPLVGFTSVAEQPWFWLMVGVSSALWCVFALQDTVLTGLRRSGLVPIENGLFSLSKIALLVLLARPDIPFAIVLSWIVPLPLLIIWINLIIVRALHQNDTHVAEQSFTYRMIMRMVGADVLGTGVSIITTNLLPLLVLWQLGAAENAHFYLAWVVVSPLLLIAANMFSSMTVEIAAQEERVYEYGRKAFLQAIVILLPAAICLFVGAGIVLSLFGADYRHKAVTDMRILTISTVPYTINVFYMCIVRLQRRIVPIILTQLMLCVSVLGLCFFLIPMIGREGAAVSWLVGQTALASFIVMNYLLRRIRTV